VNNLEMTSAAILLSQKGIERYISDAAAVEKDREKTQDLRHKENQDTLQKISTAVSQGSLTVAKDNLKVAKRGLWIAVVGCSVGIASLAFTILCFVAANWFLKH
jgi:hypothetical protein